MESCGKHPKYNEKLLKLENEKKSYRKRGETNFLRAVIKNPT